MLIPGDRVIEILKDNNIDIKGVLHIGAHKCEEMHFYNTVGLVAENIIWIDALPNKVSDAKERGIPNVYHAVVTDKDDDIVKFNVANNGESSSVLEFGTHSAEHPHVHYVSSIEQSTVTIDTFAERNKLDLSQCHFWNLDIQGAELMALRGGLNAIQYAKVIYLEVNVNELYVGCGLIGDVHAFLINQGFLLKGSEITRHGWGDALYIRKP